MLLNKIHGYKYEGLRGLSTLTIELIYWDVRVPGYSIQLIHNNLLVN